MELATQKDLAPVLRLEAWKRFSAKKWYERIVLQTVIELDVQQLSREDAIEVLHLRYLIGVHPPWKEKTTDETISVSA